MPSIEVRKEFLTARVYCIPIGTVIAEGDGDDPLTVSETTWPDNTPLENFTAWMIQDTQKLTKEKTYNVETFGKLKSTGGMAKVEEKQLEKVVFTGETFHTSALFKRLEWGLPEIPVIGEPQIPFSQDEEAVECVTLIEFQNSRGGAITESIQFWSKLTLKDDGSGGDGTRKLVYAVEWQPSGNNTFNPLA